MMEEGTTAPSGPRISPADIQRQEFGVSRFGGYRMRDVDEFLDRLTESTEQLLAENERLRTGAPMVGSADLEDVNRQADEIVQRARDEAARIVAEAHGSAAPSVSASVAMDPDQRAAVDAFLGHERAFLQGLAALVQGHAESVKAMARQARGRPTSSTTEPPGDDDAEPEGAAAGPEDRQISLPEADEPEASEDPEGPRGDATVVLETPQPTSMGSDRGREDDPSLRKLFWGGGEEG
jgi:DivIVA domain-containing protein